MIKKLNLVLLAFSCIISFLSVAQPKLWGTTVSGGSSDLGTLFEFDASAQSQVVKFNFITGPATGRAPNGNVIQCSNGKLYGLTRLGGSANLGTLYEYNPSSNTFTKKLDFSGLATGGNPRGSLVEAPNGKLYGMTTTGGTGGFGTIFEYNPTTDVFTKKIDFTGVGNGSLPNGNLIVAANGKMYGMTSAGGINGFGVLFEYDYILNTLTKKLDFNGALNGQAPLGSLLEVSGGVLYGMTQLGGTAAAGVIFEYNYLTNTYTKKVDFTGAANGRNPNGSFVKAPNGKLYAVTRIGGTANLGVLFEYDYSTNTLVKKVDFLGATNGRNPLGTLMVSSTNVLYGMTNLGGANNLGILFEYNQNTNTFTNKLDFNTANGRAPQYSDLIEICTYADVPALTANATTVCPGSQVIINITSGNLNDATDWKWYTSSCGGSPVGTGIALFPSPTVTTTYYVRGEGACVMNPTCASITINVLDNTAPVSDLSTLPTIYSECTFTLIAPTATDNCAGTVTGTTIDPMTYNTQGTFLVHWIYNDGNGNTTLQNQTIIIDDNTAPPVPILPNVNAECYSTPSPPISVDACVGPVTGTTSTAFPITTQGTTVVTWTFNDGNGNISFANQNIVIDDVTPPLTAPLPNLYAECAIAVSAPTANDNCSGIIVATTSDPTSYNSQGNYVITWYFNDGNGNSSSAIQNVIVDDVTSPLILGCPGNINVNANSAGCSGITSWIDPTATDNCASSVLLTSTHTPSFVFPLGSTTVTYTFDDGNGNTSTCNFDVTVINNLSLTTTATDASCNGGSDGAIDLTISGGTSPYLTDWNAGTFSTEDLNGLPIGLYTADVTDANGCNGSATSTINQPTAIVVTVDTFTDPTVCGIDNGSAEITASGGTVSTDYSYSWSDGSGYNSLLEDPLDLPGGLLTVTVTDDNSCTGINIVLLSDLDGPALTLNASSITDVLCTGDLTGSLDLDVTLIGTATTSTFDWNSGMFTSEDISGLGAGNYIVVATDDNGCTTTSSFDVNEPLPVSIIGITSDITCNGFADGAIDITASGGTVSGLYSYNWNSGAFSTEDLVGLNSGLFSVTVTDDNACTGTFSSAIIEPSLMTVTGVTTDASCFGLSDGSVDITVSGGTESGAYTYNWNSGLFVTEDLTNVPANNYNIVASDDNGCISIANYTINEPAAIDVSVGLSVLTITANNIDAGITYQWLDCTNSYALITGETNQSFTAIANGSYAVEITEAGCTDTSICTSITQVGLSENTNLYFNFYPNPTTGLFTLISSSSEAFISIYSIDGKMILAPTRLNSAQQVFDLTAFEKGIYLIKMSTEFEERTSRIILQ